MKRICMGDLHGDLALYRSIKSMFPGHKFTLVGDLVDSFFFSRSQQLQLLEEVLRDIEAGITECIIGNHEWSYLWPERMQCSGYSEVFASKLLPLHARMLKVMKPYVLDTGYAETILFTHAGLSARMLVQREPDPEKEISLKSFLDKECTDLENGLAYNIGRSRGGPDKFGGIYWCDFEKDFVPIVGLRQVFGHSEVDEIVEIALGNYNINCLQREHPQVLMIDDDGEVEVVDILCSEASPSITVAG